MGPMDRNIWLVHIAAARASVSFLLELTLLFASVSDVGFSFHVLSPSISSSVNRLLSLLGYCSFLRGVFRSRSSVYILKLIV